MKPKITILVVEDEALIRLDIIDQLEAEGFRVLEAGSADEAIDIMTADPSVAILFTDIDMPGSMDGLKLSSFVRNRWPPVRIVVTSGHRQVEITDLPSGSVFHSKPYRHGEVLNSIRELMSGA